MTQGSDGKEKPLAGRPSASSESDEKLLLRITRLGGHLPLLRPKREVPLVSLSNAERAAVEALLSIKAPEIAEKPHPDATSYKFELEGLRTHASITITGLKIPALLSKLLP